MEFLVAHEEAMSYHDVFMENDAYCTFANAIRSQQWHVDENFPDSQDETDKAIVLCDTKGAAPPCDNNGYPMWHEKLGLPRIPIQAPADTPDVYIDSDSETFHPTFVESVLAYVYPHCLRGTIRHLWARRSGPDLTFLLMNMRDTEQLLQAHSYPQTSRQRVLQICFPDFQNISRQN